MVNKLKAWLVKNHLTADPSDYVGVIDSMGSVDMDGIVDEVLKEGTELKRETVRDVITRFNRKCIDMVLQGYNVGTGLVNMRTTIRGALYGKAWNPDVNRLHVSVTQGLDLRRAAAAASVEIIGEKADQIAIFSVTDCKTGATDGSITRGFNIELSGTYIKVAGDDPACGVFLRNIDTGVEQKLDDIFIVLNERSRLLLLMSGGMYAGSYELRVTTQFSGNAAPLKQPRTATAPVILVTE